MLAKLLDLIRPPVDQPQEHMGLNTTSVLHVKSIPELFKLYKRQFKGHIIKDFHQMERHHQLIVLKTRFVQEHPWIEAILICPGFQQG